MRILEFEVQKQRLIKKPNCDFSGLVAGSVGYLHAKFNFKDPDWQECRTLIARFWIDDKEHAKKLDTNNSCEIPFEVLKDKRFGVSVLGVNTTYQIETNKVYIKQEVY